MISQIILFVAVAAVASASLVPVIHHAPQPYKFGYDIKDKHGEQYRQEEGNGGHAVKGSYGFTDARGIKRQVNYVADHGGFRAQVNTNEPGTANQNPAAVQVNSNAPYSGGVALGGLGYGLGYGNLDNGMGYGGYGLGGYGGYGLGGYGGNVGYGLGGYGGYGLGGYGGSGGYGLGGYGGYGASGLGGLGYGIGYGLGGLGYARYGY